ncbi:unnamed protein product, partial [marine sediment metagenome]
GQKLRDLFQGIKFNYSFRALNSIYNLCFEFCSREKNLTSSF